MIPPRMPAAAVASSTGGAYWQDMVDTMCYRMMGLFALVFIAMMSGVRAPYGRYTPSNAQRYSWAYIADARIAWILQEIPNLIVPIVFICSHEDVASTLLFNGAKSSVWINRWLLLLFFGHYCNRTLVYPFLLKTNKPVALFSFCLAFMFCTFNAFLQTVSLCQIQQYPSTWASDARFLMGSFLFIVGVAINAHSDSILRKLRSEGTVVNKGAYKIPRGGLFEYVSGANYFGEIIEWSGFALACWSLPAASFAFCTLCNLAPRAYHHHQWYQKYFGDVYPKHRRAIIPFVW